MTRQDPGTSPDLAITFFFFLSFFLCVELEAHVHSPRNWGSNIESRLTNIRPINNQSISQSLPVPIAAVYHACASPRPRATESARKEDNNKAPSRLLVLLQ